MTQIEMTLFLHLTVGRPTKSFAGQHPLFDSREIMSILWLLIASFFYSMKNIFLQTILS